MRGIADREDVHPQVHGHREAPRRTGAERIEQPAVVPAGTGRGVHGDTHRLGAVQPVVGANPGLRDVADEPLERRVLRRDRLSDFDVLEVLGVRSDPPEAHGRDSVVVVPGHQACFRYTSAPGIVPAGGTDSPDSISTSGGRYAAASAINWADTT